MNHKQSHMHSIDGMDTIPKLLKNRSMVYNHGKIAMRKKDYGIWNQYTWQDVYMHVENMAYGLLYLGFRKGDKVAILGDNDPEWYWAEWAAQCLGGTAVGIYIDCIASEIKFYIQHSDASFIFARDQEQVDKVLEVHEELPNVKKIIYWDPRGLWFYEHDQIMDIESLEDMGKRYKEERPGLVDQFIADGSGEDIAAFCYTSGTTGTPKAAMISHKNLLYAVRALWQYNKFLPSDDYLSYISPAWITEQMLALTGGVAVPFIINFPEKPETVQKDIRDIAPSIIFYGARLWENLASTIQAKITDTTRLKKFFYQIASRVSYKKLESSENGKQASPLLNVLHRIADFIVFRPLRDRIGFRKNRVGYTAGAAISPDMMKLFHMIGVNIKNLYGSTEASLVCLHKDEDIRYETVGVPFEGCDIKLSEEGEILVKNDGVFAGYYKNSEATTEVLKNGYYHTRDAGIFDGDHLVYLDRVNEMITLPNGKKFSPQFIEIRLRFSPYVKDAMVFGGRDKPFVSAILNIEYANVGKWAERNKVNYTNYSDLSQKPEVINLLKKIVAQVNAVLPDHSTISSFVSLHKEFDPDEEELTRTRKLKRKSIEKRYEDILKAIYQGNDRVKAESQVAYRDGRIGFREIEVKITHL